jgi:Fungal specific transcription factor domain
LLTANQIAIRQFIDPRQIFCLIGIAVRIAHRMGLHRDPATFGLSPFEVEQRRRLWWTLVGYDRRIGEMTGSTVTALSSGGDCKLPLNINDTDLHANGKESPTPHTGPTEMLFCLTRLTLAMAVSSDSQRDTLKLNDDKEPLTPNARKPIPMVRLANQEGPSYTLDGFCAYVENTYLKYCDPKIPLHFFTLTMTRQMLCKMRVISFLCRVGQGDNPLNEAERETLFLEAIQMIEYDNVVQSAESLQGYKWYTYLHFPFPAYMFLVTELRHRTTGPMVERAWDAISENHERRGLMNNLHSPMHIAFGNLFIKAWDARDAAERQLGRPALETPAWIDWLRMKAEKIRKKDRGNNGNHNRTSSGGDLPMGYAKAQTDPNQIAQGGVPMQPADNAMMMTPPVDAVPQVMSGGGAPEPTGDNNGGFGDMDWSYLMQEYNMNGFGGSLGFGGFGIPTVNGVVSPQEGVGMFGGGN